MLQAEHQRLSTRDVATVALVWLVAALSGCMDTSSGDSSVSSVSARTYSLGATISGLNSSGLVLAVNAHRQSIGAHPSPIVDRLDYSGLTLNSAVSVAAGATTQELANSLPANASYSVTVQVQPTGERCTIAQGSGTIQAANETNVLVACSAESYPVGGVINGLTSSGLVLVNGADALTVNSGAPSFTMPSTVTYNSAYAVTVQTQPTGLTCSVSNGTGTMAAAAVTNIAVNCSVNTYKVGGSISGLTAGGLTLLDNGGDALTLSANATQFTMNTAIPYRSAYAVTVETAPAGLVCAVNNGAGVMGGADVTNVSIDCAPNFTLVYSFAGGTQDAANPYHTLIQGSDGNFYGTTLKGGSSSAGAIFQITPSGIETVLYSFATIPYAGLVQGSDGNLYGTTATGGTSGRGTVFKVTTSGSETLVYSFPAGSSDPYTGLIEGSDGNYYGTTGAGGASDDGTVFKITASGTETVLHTFAKSGSDGQIPYAGLIQGSDGNFYGTTYFGGSNGFGTVFKVTPSGTETVLYSFAGGSDGEHPYAGVIQGTDGNFYGTTYQGGANGLGTVFKVTPSGTETVLYSFAGGNDGASPEAGVTQGNDGNFYGACYQGGANGYGTIFKITPSGTETVLHAFGGSSDGANPWANLVQGSDGNLYGTTYTGGTNGYGTFFKVALQ